VVVVVVELVDDRSVGVVPVVDGSVAVVPVVVASVVVVDDVEGSVVEAGAVGVGVVPMSADAGSAKAAHVARATRTIVTRLTIFPLPRLSPSLVRTPSPLRNTTRRTLTSRVAVRQALPGQSTR
jgi:hypothetical protein